MNSMTPKFFDEIRNIFQTLEQDDLTNVILIAAEGENFSSGLDLVEASPFLFGKRNKSGFEDNVKVLRLIESWQDSITAIANIKKPVIAAINGSCIGGGMDLITATDIRLCTQNAKFSVRETKMAIVADLGSLQRLTRIVGFGIANELCLSGDTYDANDAFRWGLVTGVFSNTEQLLIGARKLAMSIASNSPLVVQATKKILNFSKEHSIQDGLEQVRIWNTAFLKSDDLEEAIKAFFQKRKPTFRNRL